MRLSNDLIGKSVLLRTATEDDAEFILGLRMDPRLNRFLKKTDPSLQKQRDWIAKKQSEENDYHMIIQGHDGQRMGVIALYAINSAEGTFDWGRWIIAEDAPFSAAIESAILLYDLAFYGLGLKKALFEVQRANKKVINFHKRFGARSLRNDEKYEYFSFDEPSFKEALARYKKFHDLRKG